MAVVLLSGGMDSTTALAMTVEAEQSGVLALSFNYGSLHRNAELRAAKSVADYYGCEHRIIGIPPMIFEGGKSALMGQIEMPLEEYQDPKEEGPSPTVVPFRNAILLSIATAIAHSNGHDLVVFGAHASDYQGWAYPDCSPEFTGAMINAVYAGTMGEVRLSTPFTWITKSTIVQFAAGLKAPLHLTWSCYQGGLVHCGVCPTCRERITAFRTAGFIDPVEYAVPVQWGSCKEFPNAPHYEDVPF